MRIECIESDVVEIGAFCPHFPPHHSDLSLFMGGPVFHAVPDLVSSNQHIFEALS